MSETNLRKALDIHLNNMSGAPAISWENKEFDQNNQIYLTQFLLPAETISPGISIGSSDVLAGLYQVTVNVPKGADKATYLAETEKVKARFFKGLRLIEGSTAIVIHKVWTNAALTDDNYYRVPISIRYRGL